MITPEMLQAIDLMEVKSAYAWVVPAIMMAASYFAGKRGKKSSTTSTSDTSMTPTMAPEYKGIQSALLPMIQNKLANPYQLPKGYEQAGIRGINRTYDMAGQGLNNRMTARGLGGSAIAGAGESALAGGRASDIVQYQSQLPILQRQFQTEDMQQAMQAMQIGRGMNSTGRSTGTGLEGGGIGGGVNSMALMLQYLYGSNWGKNPPANN